ncbi:MAG: peptidoglycan editing factor PgeF [Prevotella sp.]|nr:peptidoglycan editing factor PgeF [Prevotella sp.]
MNSPQLTYYDMGNRVVAFSTTRQGGCSQGNYADFNINGYCGDSEEHIAANKASLAQCLGITAHQIVMPHQVHGREVVRIDHPSQTGVEADAVMTNLPGLCIGVSTADCIPVLLYDEQQHAACAVHAGWRGTVQRIVDHAVTAMQLSYGTDPAQLRAVIGPGISLDSFEVGDEVYDSFAAAGFEMAAISRHDEKWHIDLPVCNQIQLQEAGVRAIYLSGICTYQHADRYFSARRLGIQSGRIFTAIMLK